MKLKSIIFGIVLVLSSNALAGPVHTAVIRSQVADTALFFTPADDQVATVTLSNGGCGTTWVPAVDAPLGSFAQDGRDGCQASIRWTAPYPNRLGIGVTVKLFVTNRGCPRVARVEAHGNTIPPLPELPTIISYNCSTLIYQSAWSAVKRLYN